MNKMIESFFNKERFNLKIMLFVLIFSLLLPVFTTKRLKLGNEYETKEDVALYIKTFHELPANYITKDAVETASTYGGDLTDKVVGGDTHWNTNQLSNFGISSNANLKECDIKGLNYNLLASIRGRQRLVYTSNTKNVRVFYSDHYEVGTFEEITTFELQLTRNIFWIIFGLYFISASSFLIVAYKKTRPKSKDGDII